MGELSYTVGGDSNLVSFKSAARVPITSLKAHFKPKQDLHGYSKPWPAGGGKNLFNINSSEQDPSNIDIYNNSIRIFTPGTYTRCASWSNYRDPSRILDFSILGNIMTVKSTTGYGVGYAITILPETQYAISAIVNGVGASINIAYYDSNGNFLSEAANETNVANSVITTPSNSTIAVLIFRGTYADTAVTFANIQFEKSSSITSYEPYENICPIEGWDSINIYHDYTKLPIEYQHVEYLQANGQQFFDTGISIINEKNIYIEIDFEIDSGVGGDLEIMGTRNKYTGYAEWKFPNIYTNNIEIRGYGISDNNVYIISRDDRTSMIFDYKDGSQKVYVNGQNVKSWNNAWKVSEATYTLYAFSGHDQNTDTAERKITGRIYKIYIQLEGIPIRNYIPCYRKSDNKPGMYDTVSETFFTNQGTGEFICGPDVGCTIPITFPVLGKNKFDPSYFFDADNYTNAGAWGYTYTDPIFLIPNTEYCLSFTRDGSAEDDPVLYWCMKVYTGEEYETASDSQTIRYYAKGANGLRQYSSFITGPTGVIRFAINRQSYTDNQAALTDLASKAVWQLELGSTATTYEPYNSDNTVYGGYLNVVDGEVVDDEAEGYCCNKIVLDGTEAWEIVKQNDDTTIFKYFYGLGARRESHEICSHFYWFISTYNTLNIPNSFIQGMSGNLFIQTSNNIASTIEQFTSFLSQEFAKGTPVTILYQSKNLAIHHPIVSTQLQTLLNQNNIWSNTNDITEVSYAIHDTAPIRAAKERMIAFAAKKEEEIRVPSAYRKLQYISAVDSNPYITTSITYPNELEAEVHFYNTKTEAFVFGARNDISKKPYCNLNISSDADKIRFDYGDYKYHVSTTGKTGEKIFKFHNRVATMVHVDTSTTRTYSYDTAVFTSYTTNPLLLFAVNTNGSPSLGDSQGELRMYSAKFWVGGKLVGNFLPCKRKSDDVVGMYDTITKQFYTSTNTDTFTAGPVA